MFYLLVKAVHTPQLLHPSSIPPNALVTDQAGLVVIILSNINQIAIEILALFSIYTLNLTSIHPSIHPSLFLLRG